ncbi:hypothetical protein [Anaeromicrobium sediminis]|uniref:Phage tail protein n=1 Tax=Anaeromicrobium sediminis TaxID=1478221 RepID=A0A267MRF6_9FIRM|nr:hypothetical protein [Anaeromicrobium sediminis]PAB61320.1 hypothetical protein CCE28_02490 [Anaeromicrobium sediminis]
MGDKVNVLVGAPSLIEISRDDEATWKSVGYTEGGVQFSQSVETYEVEVDQELDPIDEIVIKRRIKITTQLVESILDNIALALNYDPSEVITEDGTKKTKTLDIKSKLDIQKFAVRFTGKGPSGKHRRWTIKKVGQIGEVSMGLQKGDKTVIPLELKVYNDGSGSLGSVVDSEDAFA